MPQLLHSFLTETLFSVSATGCQSKLSHCLFFPEPEQILSLPFPSSAFPADGVSLDLPHQVHRHPFLELRALLRVSALLGVQSREEPPFSPAASGARSSRASERIRRASCAGTEPGVLTRGADAANLPPNRGGETAQGWLSISAVRSRMKMAFPLVACPPQSCHQNLPWG